MCGTLYNRIFKDIRLVDLQFVIDHCGKNYPSMKKIKGLFNQLYDFAMKNDICNKDYSAYVDITRYSDHNPDRRDHNRFSREELDRLWQMKEDPYDQIVLMLIYNGCRISEFLDLRKENIHLDEQYFDVIASKTDNGLRKVPIADKVLPFYKAWYPDLCRGEAAARTGRTHMNVQEFKAFTRDIRKMTKLADKVEALINGANLLNSKGRLEQLVPLVKDLLVRFGKMKTQLAQYQEAFTTIIAENEQLKKENCILEDERRQRNRHDMDSRTAIHQMEQKCQRYEKQLAAIPPEVLAQYTRQTSKQHKMDR